MNRFRDIIMNRPMPERVSPKIQPIELPTEKVDDLIFVNEVEEEKKEMKQDSFEKKKKDLSKIIEKFRVKQAFTLKELELEVQKIL
jgi:hypothetical protein